MDLKTYRLNERLLGLASICDNASLAAFIAAVVQGYANAGVLAALDVVAGFVLVWAGWRIRGKLKLEA